MDFEQLDEFKKDVKKLTKKYRSLPDDLLTVKQVLEVLPDARPPFSYQLNNLGINSCVIKVKKIACKSLKGKGINSGLRLVYAYFSFEKASQSEGEPKSESKESTKIIFIELYHKSDKSQEDRNRILKHFR